MTTTADLIRGVPSWATPLVGICGYCASPGRTHYVIHAEPPVKPGECLQCGMEMESVTCVPGEPCEDLGHEPCECGFQPIPCEFCRGYGVCLGACTWCHATNRILEEHCCQCKVADRCCPCGDFHPGDCYCPIWSGPAVDKFLASHPELNTIVDTHR